MRVNLEDAHLLPLELINQVKAQETEKITHFSHPVLTMQQKKIFKTHPKSHLAVKYNKSVI